MDARATEVSRAVRDRSFDFVFRWMVLFGLICLAGVILWDFGYLGYLYAADTSNISAIISAIFIVLSLYCLYMLVAYSPELSTLGWAMNEFEAGGQLALDGSEIRVGTYTLPRRRAVTQLLRDIMVKHRFDPDGGRDVLVQSLGASLRARLRIGILMADVLYKLGLLGTVIGFIVMLGSIGNLGEFEVTSMRSAMQAMSNGMAISLLTTIAGLVCGTLLRMQFMLAEGLVSAILQRAVRLTEVFLIPTMIKAKNGV